MSGGQSQSVPEVGDVRTLQTVKTENRNLIFESWHFFFESQQVFLENFATFEFKDLMTLTWSSFRHLSQIKQAVDENLIFTPPITAAQSTMEART